MGFKLNRHVRLPLLLAALSGAAAFTPAVSEGAVVERVVAVVGEKAILLSELRHRARPFMGQIAAAQGAQRAAATSQLLGQLLDRMIDEELQRRAASRSNITVTAQEVEDALSRVATQNKISIQDLIDEAKRSGLSGKDYRQELRRQLLEAKLMNLRAQGRIRITEDDLKREYQKLKQAEVRTQGFRIAWIELPVSASPTADELARQRKLGQQIAAQARNGADFAELVRRHSVDAESRQAGGLLPAMKPGSLPPAMDQALFGLSVGGVTEPIRIGRDFYVAKLVERDASTLPPFEQLAVELQNRVYVQKMEKTKRHWLDSLRKRTHVELRL